MEYFHKKVKLALFKFKTVILESTAVIVVIVLNGLDHSVIKV